MSCAFTPCSEAQDCALVGGCVTRRFGPAPIHSKAKKSRALAGYKPARPNRDPALIKRRRKALR